MNRVLAASLLSVVLFSLGCRSSGVGDPCIPELEFTANHSSAASELFIDVNSSQCDTRVCLSHYFRGRVTCPFGNGNKRDQSTAGKKCKEVKGQRGLYKLEGTDENCCPVLGDLEEKPMDVPVPSQCAARPAVEAVYCSCRCGTAGGLDTGSLCECPDGYECKEICSETKGGCSVFPPGKWGSYCVKKGPLGAGFDPESTSGQDLCRSGAEGLTPSGE